MTLKGTENQLLIMEKLEIYSNGNLRGSNAFEDETVTVPDGVLNISNAVFRFHQMRELILPEGLQCIIDYACEECKQLEKIRFPQSLQEIGFHAFSECVSLKQVQLPDKLRKIESDAFNGSGLEEIFLPLSVKSYSGAFSGCKKLRKAVIEKGIKRVDESAFSGCVSLTKVVLPKGLTEIKSYAFFGCVSLESIVIPETVTKIGANAFKDCKNLKSINIPQGLQKLGRDAFKGCDSLPPLELPEYLIHKERVTKSPEIIELATEARMFMLTDKGEVTGVDNRKAKYNMLYIPNDVCIVAGGAFAGLNVCGIVLPDGLEEIRANAFKDCVNFRKVYIPKTVKIIEKDAFAGCGLLKIYCEGEPQEGWIDKPDEKKVYYDDMTEAFNFHRSSGSFDERHIVERTEIIRNTYNPEKRPVYTNVSREEFLKTIKH